MDKYFHISNGLRGGYMPDNSSVVIVSSLKTLRAILQCEGDSLADAGFRGASKKHISSLASAAWKHTGYLPLVMPLAPPHARSNYCYGLFVASATEDEWNAYCEDD